MPTDPKPLAIIPLPCDARLMANLLNVVNGWYRKRHGAEMHMGYVEQAETEGMGKVLLIWDRPVEGGDRG